MDRRLVYGLSPKLTVSPEKASSELEWCGMLREEDSNGVGLKVLAQYHFELQDNLSPAKKKLAKRLKIGFIWQKFNIVDEITNSITVFQRLLFVDYETETPREDYPVLAKQGVYYEVGELLPYICIDKERAKAMLYGNSDFLAYRIENVLLSINDQKYKAREYQELFSSQITPYQRWFENQEKKYHYSFTHQSYSHSLFMPFKEWVEKITQWKQNLTNEMTAANAQTEYELLLKKQISRINYEIIRVISAKPKDYRTISGFKEQLDELRQQNINLYKTLPHDASTFNQELDDIITDIDPDDGQENSLALQDLLIFILNISSNLNEKDIAEVSLDDFIALNLTTYQTYKIFNITIAYFLSTLKFAETSTKSYQIDSHQHNLIAFAAQALIYCLAFLISKATISDSNI